MNGKWRLFSFIRGIIIRRKAKMTEVDAETTSASKQIDTKRKSNLLAESSVVTASEYTIYNDTDAPITAVSSTGAGSKRVMAVIKKIGLVGYRIGEGVFSKTIGTQRTSKLMHFISHLFSGKRVTSTQLTAVLRPLEIETIQVVKKITNATTVDGVAITSMSATATIKETTQSNAGFFYWFYPQKNDGDLAIIQAYNVTQTDNILEVK